MYIVIPFKINNLHDMKYKSITKAPQNMCYCYDKDGNKYVLISIHPEYLVNILNGKKTIEVRKKILNDLKKLIYLEEY